MMGGSVKKGGFWSDDRVRLLFLLGSCAAVTGAGWWGYQAYKHSVNERTQALLAAQQLELGRLTGSADLQALADRLANLAYEQRRSDLAPFLSTLRSEALLRAGDAPKALQVLREALQAMSSDNPLRPLYAVKEAVLLLNGDTAAEAEGVALLKKLGDDRVNPQRALALYYLWHHLWIGGKGEEAAQVLTKLKSLRSGLPWGEIAQAQIDVM